MGKLLTLVLVLIASLSTAYASGRVCATVFQSSYQTGHHMAIEDGRTIRDLNAYTLDVYMQPEQSYYSENWDNRISLIMLEPNCELTGFQYQNFGVDYGSGTKIGTQRVFKNYRHYARDYNYLHDFDNLISSLTCYCY